MLKATGEDIAFAEFEWKCRFCQGEAARLVAISGDAEKAAEWSLRELTPATGFTGAVAIRRGTSNIEHRTLNFEGGNVEAMLSASSEDAEIHLRCWKWG